ncbi:MAG: hypothetical protein ACR2J1_00245 [Methyloceanibacter sp.]|uniref:hypothetical protein n=1 Tax=Methyloceanibacter sp. TaxID=1965321 RepID=UPI003D9B869C
MRKMISTTVLGLFLAFSSHALAAEIDWSMVDTALGKTASVQGEVHRYGLPRMVPRGLALAPFLFRGSKSRSFQVF